mmetsp:Transcript_6046/g.16481  ORF Transcript_6046/g.16481 Transcript_6046/m.16481 type:complete len:113 (-) Transcript_6046:1521-1859(-)
MQRNNKTTTALPSAAPSSRPSLDVFTHNRRQILSTAKPHIIGGRPSSLSPQSKQEAIKEEAKQHKQATQDKQTARTPSHKKADLGCQSSVYSYYPQSRVLHSHSSYSASHSS